VRDDDSLRRRIADLERQYRECKAEASQMGGFIDERDGFVERLETAARLVTATNNFMSHCEHEDPLVCDGNDPITAYLVSPEHMEALRSALEEL
jgi:hypothetical protein